MAAKLRWPTWADTIVETEACVIRKQYDTEDAYPWCTLCLKWCSEEHIASKQHVRRRWWMEETRVIDVADTVAQETTTCETTAYETASNETTTYETTTYETISNETTPCETGSESFLRPWDPWEEAAELPNRLRHHHL